MSMCILPAEKLLSGLQLETLSSQHSPAVILVANKTDLVRNRAVKAVDGRDLAVKYNIKYIETSPGGWQTDQCGSNNIYLTRRCCTGINHNIDELLVGVYSQIQLRRAAPASRSLGSARTKVNTIILLRTGFRVLTKVKSA